jgi:ubiquinone/menaquinone biosynthesis C-methylase UbiE
MKAEKHKQRGLERAEGMLRHIDTDGVRDFLELGCGVGHVSKLMASKFGWNVTATDYDPEMIKFATEGVEDEGNIRFMQADATQLQFEDASYDVVLSFGILHHIKNWGDGVAEVSRVLRPGGHYLLGEFVFGKVSKALFGGRTRNYGIYTYDDLVSCLEENGLHVVHHEGPKGAFLKYHGLVLRRS